MTGLGLLGLGLLGEVPGWACASENPRVPSEEVDRHREANEQPEVASGGVTGGDGTPASEQASTGAPEQVGEK